MGGSSPEYIETPPIYDPISGDYLDSIHGSLGDWNPSVPTRPDGTPLYDSIQDTIGQIGGIQGAYQDFLGNQGQDWILDRAQGYVDPEMINTMTAQNQAMLDSSLSGIAEGANMAGGAGGSRQGIASGLAGSEASKNLNAQLLDYQNQQIDRATGDFNTGMQGFQNQVGSAVQYQQFMRDLQQGDSNAAWMGDLVGSNPDIIRALLYNMVANSSPTGTITQQ